MEIELEIELKKSYQNPSQRFVRFRTGLSLEVIGDLDGTLGVSMLLRIGRIRKYMSINLTIRRVFSTFYCRRFLWPREKLMA